MWVVSYWDATFDEDVARTVDVAVDKQFARGTVDARSARDNVAFIVPQPVHVLLVYSSVILERRVPVNWHLKVKRWWIRERQNELEDKMWQFTSVFGADVDELSDVFHGYMRARARW